MTKAYLLVALLLLLPSPDQAENVNETETVDVVENVNGTDKSISLSLLVPSPGTGTSTGVTVMTGADGTVDTQALMAQISQLQSQNQQLQTLTQSCSPTPSVSGDNIRQEMASSSINWGQISQLVSQGSLTITQITTMLNAVGVNQYQIPLIISGTNVNTGMLQQILAQKQITTSQIQAAMTQAGFNQMVIHQLMNANSKPTINHFPNSGNTVVGQSPNLQNPSGLASNSINWGQISQLLSQGSLTVTQVMTMLNAVGISQNQTPLIISGSNVNTGMLQQILAQNQITTSQIQAAMTQAGFDQMVIHQLVNSHGNPTFNPLPNPGANPHGLASSGINWSQLQQLLLHGSVTSQQMHTVFTGVGLTQSQIPTVMTGNNMNIALLQQLLNAHQVTTSQITSAMAGAGISFTTIQVLSNNHGHGGPQVDSLLLPAPRPQYPFPTQTTTMPSVWATESYPPQGVPAPVTQPPNMLYPSGAASAGINWGQLSQLVSQGTLTIPQITTMLNAVGVNQAQIPFIISGTHVNTGLLQQIFTQNHITTQQFQAAMAQAGVNQMIINMLLNSNSNLHHFPSSTTTIVIIRENGPATTGINWGQLSQFVSHGSLSIAQLTAALNAVGVNQNQIPLIISGSNVNTAMLQQILAQNHVSASQMLSAMAQAGVNQMIINMLVNSNSTPNINLLNPSTPSVAQPLLVQYPNGLASSGINWSQLQQLLLQGSVTSQQMQTAFTGVGLTHAQIQTFMTGNNISNIPLLQQLLNAQQVTMAQIVSAMAHAGITGNFINQLVSNNPIQGGTTLNIPGTVNIPGGSPSTLPPLRPQDPVVPHVNSTDVGASGSVLPQGVSCPSGNNPGVMTHYFKTSMDDDSDDDWFKNWYARYKQLLAYIGDKTKIDANPVAKGAFNDAEYWLIDGYRNPGKKWSESRKDYYNRWMENDLNKMGKALLGSKWTTFRCGASVNGYRGDCGMIC